MEETELQILLNWPRPLITYFLLNMDLAWKFSYKISRRFRNHHRRLLIYRSDRKSANFLTAKHKANNNNEYTLGYDELGFIIAFICLIILLEWCAVLKRP